MNDLGDAIKAVIEVRYWEQFHSPKILAMTLSVEMSEVTEHFHWLRACANRRVAYVSRGSQKAVQSL